MKCKILGVGWTLALWWNCRPNVCRHSTSVKCKYEGHEFGHKAKYWNVIIRQDEDCVVYGSSPVKSVKNARRESHNSVGCGNKRD